MVLVWFVLYSVICEDCSVKLPPRLFAKLPGPICRGFCFAASSGQETSRKDLRNLVRRVSESSIRGRLVWCSWVFWLLGFLDFHVGASSVLHFLVTVVLECITISGSAQTDFFQNFDLSPILFLGAAHIRVLWTGLCLVLSNWGFLGLASVRRMWVFVIEEYVNYWILLIWRFYGQGIVWLSE